MKMKNKKLYLTVIGALLLVFIIIGVSYAYFSAKLIEVNKTETKIKTQVMGLSFTGQTEIKCESMVPGNKCIKTFKVENTSDKVVTYNIYMENITNEFNEDLVYTLTDESGTVVSETYLPKNNSEKTYIKLNVNIDPKPTAKNYTLTIEYKHREYDQSKYQGAEFRATVGIDAEQFTIINCPNYNCEIPEGSSIAQIIDDKAIITKKKTIINELEEKNTTYQTEKMIAHDIYYSDPNLYTNGLNKRYVTYCTPYENDNESGVVYCTEKNRSGSCKKVTTTKTCSYQTAKKDLGLTTFEYQKKREDFADAGNGNWHIQTFCEQAKAETPYEGGYYYCDLNEDLHDWYDLLEIEEENSETNFICKRATELHTEICNQSNASLYCRGAGYTKGSTITYGSLGTKGTLASGDAFDCDVNGDGTYDSDTERFYFVSYKYIGGTTGNETYDTNTATLMYYNNISGGIANNTTTYAYNSDNTNYNGPVTAVKQLPKTSQWSNVSLKNTKRAILNEVGGNYNTVSNTNYELPGNGKEAFDYSNYAARLLTAQEVNVACNITGGNYTTGELDTCQYLIENTQFSTQNITAGYWLETPLSSTSDRVWYVEGAARTHHKVTGNFVLSASTSGNYGVRPAIDIPLVNIEY